MHLTSITARLTVLNAALITGCVSVPPEAGFPEVSEMVSQRSGQRLHWYQGGEEDEAVAAEVRDLLSHPLTHEAAVQVAPLNNRRLQATYEDLSVAQADLVQAGLLRNPVFDAEIRLDDGGGTGLELALVQDFLDVFQIPLRKRVAGAAFEAAKLEVARTVIDTAKEVRVAMIDLVEASQRRDMLESVVDATAASDDLARRLHSAGNITDLMLASERARQEQAKLDLAEAEASEMLRRERLNVLMGLWGPESAAWTAIDRLPQPPQQSHENRPGDHHLRLSLDHSLTLASSRYRLEALGQRLGLTRSQSLVPEFEAGVKGDREGGSDDWTIGPVFSLPLPLFDQGQASIAAAAAEVRRQADYYADAVEVRRATALATLEADRARVVYYEQVMLPLQRRIVDETQLQYNAMQVGTFELLRARATQIETGSRYVQSLADYWRAEALLRSLTEGGSAQMSGPERSRSESSSSTSVDAH